MSRRSQGAEWKTAMSAYIAAMPGSGSVAAGAMQSRSAGPPP